jgi:hypothetical protein
MFLLKPNISSRVGVKCTARPEIISIILVEQQRVLDRQELARVPGNFIICHAMGLASEEHAINNLTSLDAGLSDGEMRATARRRRMRYPSY